MAAAAPRRRTIVVVDTTGVGQPEAKALLAHVYRPGVMTDLARRANIRLLAKNSFPVIHALVAEYVEKLLRITVRHMKHYGRKGVTEVDLRYALLHMPTRPGVDLETMLLRKASDEAKQKAAGELVEEEIDEEDEEDDNDFFGPDRR